jgi:hypothetical protein
MLKWSFFKPVNFLMIAGIALLARVMFNKAFDALDGAKQS